MVFLLDLILDFARPLLVVTAVVLIAQILGIDLAGIALSYLQGVLSPV
ncbi:hypothetical protein ACFQH6_15125 [Halobacteriaceae archaeon GCM10025711]